MSDEEEIQRLVDHLIEYGFDDTLKVPDESSARRLRDAAREVHAKWKANPKIEDVPVKVDDVRAGAETTSIDETFDYDELEDIFSGREEAERADAVRLEKEWEEEKAREAEEKRRAKAAENKRGILVMLGIVLALAIGITWVFMGKGHEEHREKHHDKNETHRPEQR